MRSEVVLLLALALSSCGVTSTWETDSHHWRDRVVKGL